MIQLPQLSRNKIRIAEEPDQNSLREDSDTFSASVSVSASATARVILGVSSAQIGSDLLSFDN